MSLVPITDVGKVGIIEDIPPYNLPPNAWSGGNNVRFLDNGVKKVEGYAEVMATCPFAPYVLYHYLTVGLTRYWIAFGSAAIAVFNGSTWTDVTRQTTNTLDGTINNSVTTVTLTDASLFPTSGTIAIGSKQYGYGNTNYYEEITYSGKSTNDLTGCTRAVGAVGHDSGAVVTPVGTTATSDNPYTIGTDIAKYRWIVTNLNGLLVATNGKDAPQMWPLSSINAEPQTTVPFRELQNWPSASAISAGGSGNRCAAMRAFRTFLVGLDWNNAEDRAVEEPRMVKWSTEATYYTAPVTWARGDITLDAGEYELADTPGDIVDGLPLGDSFLIYKDDSIYIMNYVGTPYIFSFKLLSPTIGLLARDAIAEYEGGHFFMGNSDFYLCNGQSITALLPNKVRRAVFDDLNADNYLKCFVSADYIRNEMLACYPSGASDVVDKALIWNWKENTFSFRDLPGVSHMNSGVIEITAGSQWGAYATLNEASMTPSSPATAGNLTVISTTSDPVFTSTGTLVLKGDTDPYADEQITYTGVTGTTFTGITRGANGTVAASHDNSIIVNQFTDTWNATSNPWGASNYDNIMKNMVFVHPGIKATITAATKADPVVITAAAHGLTDGDSIIIDSVVGMTQLNGNTYTVAGKTTDTFQLSGVDGTGYSTYGSGGQVVQPKLYRDNWGNKSDTETMTAYIERTGYDLGDPSVVKCVTAIWPKLEVSGDNAIKFWIGSQMSTEEGVAWEGPVMFNPNSQSKVSCRVSGKFFGVKVESDTDVDWKLHGVDFEVMPRGNRGSRMQV